MFLSFLIFALSALIPSITASLLNKPRASIQAMTTHNETHINSLFILVKDPDDSSLDFTCIGNLPKDTPFPIDNAEIVDNSFNAEEVKPPCLPGHSITLQWSSPSDIVSVTYSDGKDEGRMIGGVQIGFTDIYEMERLDQRCTEYCGWKWGHPEV